MGLPPTVGEASARRTRGTFAHVNRNKNPKQTPKGKETGIRLLPRRVGPGGLESHVQSHPCWEVIHLPLVSLSSSLSSQARDFQHCVLGDLLAPGRRICFAQPMSESKATIPTSWGCHKDKPLFWKMLSACLAQPRCPEHDSCYCQEVWQRDAFCFVAQGQPRLYPAHSRLAININKMNAHLSHGFHYPN